jgi:protein TonB
VDNPAKVDNPADTAPPEKTRDATAPEKTREFAASTEIAPATAANPSGARPAERGARSRNPERPSVTPRYDAAGSPRNNTAGSSRNSAAGATTERETASGAAPGGISADESLQTVYNPAPRYPEQARRRGREGTVLVEADVDERGVPAAVRVLRSSGFGILDDAAVEAVGKWRFRPARSTGKTMPGRVVVPIEFRLKKF